MRLLYVISGCGSSLVGGVVPGLSQLRENGAYSASVPAYRTSVLAVRQYQHHTVRQYQTDA
eukprot:3611831-Rhodomonas_salina.4